MHTDELHFVPNVDQRRHMLEGDLQERSMDQIPLHEAQGTDRRNTVSEVIVTHKNDLNNPYQNPRLRNGSLFDINN